MRVNNRFVLLHPVIGSSIQVRKERISAERRKTDALKRNMFTKGTPESVMHKSLAIHFAAVADLDDRNSQNLVFDLRDDPVISDSILPILAELASR
jgi:hypothetical protein